MARIGYTGQIDALSGLSGPPARVDRYDNGYLSASAGSTVTLPDPDGSDGGNIDLILDHRARHGAVVLDGPSGGGPVFAAAISRRCRVSRKTSLRRCVNISVGNCRCIRRQWCSKSSHRLLSEYKVLRKR